MAGRAPIRIGTSGWIYEHWRGRFYPESLPVARWFEHYARHFDTVEINNTFYGLPDEGSFDAWQQQAPRGFMYAVKASRFLTHMKKLKDPAEPLARLLGRARRLAAHLGPVLYQLPPHWRPDEGRLRAFCAALPRDLVHVMEFRERAWLQPRILAVLAEHRVALCIHDLLPDHPRELTAPTAYVRFHGTSGHYRGRYTRRELGGWARWMSEAAAAGHAVFAYFNNDAEAHAIADARTLRSILEHLCAPSGAAG